MSPSWRAPSFFFPSLSPPPHTHILTPRLPFQDYVTAVGPLSFLQVTHNSQTRFQISSSQSFDQISADCPVSLSLFHPTPTSPMYYLGTSPVCLDGLFKPWVVRFNCLVRPSHGLVCPSPSRSVTLSQVESALFSVNYLPWGCPSSVNR